MSLTAPTFQQQVTDMCRLKYPDEKDYVSLLACANSIQSFGLTPQFSCELGSGSCSGFNPLLRTNCLSSQNFEACNYGESVTYNLLKNFPYNY